MTTAAVIVQSAAHRYGKTVALDGVSLQIPAGGTVGLVGPDGVGKSTLLSLIAGVRVIQEGSVQVLGQDIADPAARAALLHRIAYMPQGLGHNLYPTLSVYENIDFHARLFGLPAEERRQRIHQLMEATGLAPFPDRPAGKLSGGMKQKLSLCCALVHSPDLLILDEPTTGVDPLSRRQFWALVKRLQQEHAGMTVIVATAYIEEAEQFEYLLAMDSGRLLTSAPTREVMAQHQAKTLEEAYIALLPPERRSDATGLQKAPFQVDPDSPPAIEAHGLTKRFGSFTAVDHVSFRIERGEIFGFLGSNGCGKSTTMKMLTGLLDASEGSAELLGKPIGAGGMDTRMRVGYMSQAFSLYEELTVRQNLELHAKLYQINGEAGRTAVESVLQQFDLSTVADTAPASLSLGMRQRLQLAAACLHHPEVLILDEPTSGVDPAARDLFWRHLIKLSREDKITIFVSTHFMNEAARCDRISFMDKGRVLAVGTPEELVEKYQAPNLEEAFVQYLLADNDSLPEQDTVPNQTETTVVQAGDHVFSDGLKYWLATVWTFALREGKELLRDRIRLFFALMGPVILMSALVWSVSFDVQDQRYAVLDRDHSVQSRQINEYFSGSRYFVEQAPLGSDEAMRAALKNSRIRMALDIPPDFGRQLLLRNRPQLGVYIDGSAPFNASSLEGFVGGIAGMYALDQLRVSGLPIKIPDSQVLEPRYRYNQDFRSINAIAPGVLMMVLILIPAMMTALGVVREREIGSITNLYASPAGVLQYLLGKQLPYVVVGMLNYVVLVALCVWWFAVPLKGSLAAMTLGALLLVAASTAFGLVISSLVRSQVAAVFVTAVISLIPTINFSGLIYPTNTLSGGAWLIGMGFPATWFQRISIGGFTKGLGFADFQQEYGVLLLFYAVYLGVARLNLKKQEK